jgi:uroporphyrinogen decarboxylase
MNSRERVQAVLDRKIPDRTPRFEVWIDALYDELGVSDPYRAYAELGQDGILIPLQIPPGSNAWRDGVDEFGRVWKHGMYQSGVVLEPNDLRKYSPPETYADLFFNESQITEIRAHYPEHCLFFGTHIGPFMGAYMAMGMENMFLMLRQDLPFVRAVLEARAEWCLAIFKRAVDFGAQVIIMGDDSAHRNGPLISPDLWQKLVLPLHERIVRELPVPVFWHSDGKMEKLLPYAVAAGFHGVHGLEPLANNRLDEIKSQYGDRLVIIGNLDISVLFENDLDRVRAEIQRCYQQGGEGGYMLSTCNSICAGMKPTSVREYFDYG